MPATNTAAAEEVVRAFFSAWERDGFVAAFERYLHPDAIWQNTGFPDARGRQAIVGLMQQYLALSGMPYGRVELRHLAVAGNTVLTERVDHLYDGKGKSHATPIMGAMTVEGGLITRYADYFDPRQFFDMVSGA